jgi:hypothetical protein
VLRQELDADVGALQAAMIEVRANTLVCHGDQAPAKQQ